jgi:hypothetical protein
MEIITFLNGVFATHKFNEGERIPPTDKQKFHGLPTGNELLGWGF